jgi:hypothetical protein
MIRMLRHMNRSHIFTQYSLYIVRYLRLATLNYVNLLINIINYNNKRN